MLKPYLVKTSINSHRPAAFGRLCVETILKTAMLSLLKPAAFGRLCVETVSRAASLHTLSQPPSGGCVLKPNVRQPYNHGLPQPPSGGCVLKHSFISLVQRLPAPAAFGRLCVETSKRVNRLGLKQPSRLRAAVC